MARIVLMLAFLVMAATAEEQQAQARQMNWNGIKSIGKPANYLPDADGSMTAQAKSSSNYQSLPSQSLDGQGDLNRDGPYSGGDYAYEPSSDSAYGGVSGSGYGYDYQRYLPTTSKPFFSVSGTLHQQQQLPLPRYQQQQAAASAMTAIPNSFLRGVPRDQLDHPISSLSGMQSGRISTPHYQQMGGFQYNYNNNGSSYRNDNNQMTNRAGYDEDIPLGGISSTSSGFAGTTMRNAIGTSRQDDFSYGTVNSGVGFGSIPPSPGLVSGYGSFASPGYSSNYATPYAGSNYVAPYSYAGYSSYPSTGYAGGLGNAGYSSYPAGDVSYRSPLYSNYAYGYGGYQPTAAAYYKKPKKAFLDWFKFNKHLAPYSTYGGYGSYGAAVPYDYYYDPPSLWFITKFAFKSMFKSLFKPFFKWLPFCSPFVYYDRDDRA